MLSFKSANPNRLIVRGLISFLLGVAIIVYPEFTLENVIRFLGALMVADGLLALAISYFQRQKKQSSFVIIPRGSSNLIFGAILLLFPTVMVNVFVFVIGFILVFAGITQLATQLSGRSSIGFSWLMFLIAVVSTGAGILLLTKPFESAETMLTIFAVIIALYGIGEFVWSFKIRKFQSKQPKQEPATVDAEYEEIKD